MKMNTSRKYFSTTLHPRLANLSGELVFVSRITILLIYHLPRCGKATSFLFDFHLISMKIDFLLNGAKKHRGWRTNLLVLPIGRSPEGA